MHALDLQLLASKDQALEAWRSLCARWENLSGHRVKVFRSDNGDEFINEVFTAMKAQRLTAVCTINL
jgi:hypothetical protein